VIGHTATRADEFTALLERHGADLSRLRGSRGVIPCILPGHADRRASLSLDIAAAVFNCFSCHRGGGLLRLRELLGEEAPSSRRQPRRETEAQRLLRKRAAVQRAAAARRAEIVPLWLTSDAVRRCLSMARSLRELAAQWGPAHPATWPMLEQAARAEVQGFNLGAAIDFALRRRA